MAIPRPTAAERRAAWQKVRQSLLEWVFLYQRAEEAESLLAETRGRMRHRKNELVRDATYRKLYLIRKRLGNKFLKLPLTGRPPAPLSPKKTAPEPSRLRTETLPSPPSPST